MNIFSQSVKTEEWKFRPKKVEAQRLRSLEQDFPFSAITQRVADEMTDIKFYPEKGKTEAKNKKRAEFFFRIDTKTLDIFFNGPQGYRAQYYLDPQRGNDCNRFMIDILKGKLIEAARQASQELMTIEQIEKSLEYESAKIWIDEGKSSLNKKCSDPQEILVLEVPRWVAAMNQVLAAWNAGQQPEPTIMDRALLGVQAPVGVGGHMKVLGAWLDVNDRVFVVQSKINRAQQIYNYGFS